jgi:1,4-dihydroxy-2-naphthoate octaprenyltransferase
VFSLGLMTAGQVTALALPPLFGTLYAACFVLSVLYSVPPFRLKAVAGADWLINMVGFGTLTPLAGWATTARPVNGVTWLVLLGFGPLFAALYPLTQLYQLEEDSRRGDRTLALMLGVRRSVDVALVAAGAAFALFAWAALRSAWPPGAPWRWSALAVAFLAWAAVLVPWRLRADRLDAHDHQRRMYLALGAWAATDLAVLLAWGT